MSRITMAGGDARHFSAGDAVVVTSLWPMPRWWRLLRWATRRPLTTTATRRAPTFREAWRGVIEERQAVYEVTIGAGGAGSLEVR